MALLECPDCGKHVSERAISCPNCGCPRSFFVAITSNNSYESSPSLQEKSEDNSDNTTDENTELSEVKEYKYSFTLGDKTFSYTEDDKIIANLYGVFLRMALESQEKMEDALDSCGNVREAFEKCRSLGNKIVNTVLDECMRYLYSYNIKITVSQFKSKYQRDYNFRFDGIIDELQREVGDLEYLNGRLAAERAREISSRGRWSGGGFGLKGAIKGAATASLLNAGTDLLYAGHDSRREREDNALINKKATSLKNKGNNAISDVTYEVVMNIFYAYWEELEYNKVVFSELEIDQDEADQLFETTLKYETDEKSRINNILDCISMYPGEQSYYSEIYDFLLSCDQFLDFIEFWNIEFLLEDYIEDKCKYDEKLVKQKESEKRLTEHSIPSFDYDDLTEENELAFLLLRYEYYRKIDNIETVDQDLRTYEYFTSIREKRPLEIDKVIFFWPPNNISMADFLLLVTPSHRAGTSDFDSNQILYFEEVKVNQLYGCSLIVGEKIIWALKSNYKLTDLNTSKATTNGYIFSDHRIVDLKTKNQINLSTVEFMDIILCPNSGESIGANICFCDKDKNGVNIYFCGKKHEVAKEQSNVNLYEEIISRFYNSNVKRGIGKLYPDSKFSVLCICLRKLSYVACLLTIYDENIVEEEINTHTKRSWSFKVLSSIDVKENALVLSGKALFSYESFDISDSESLFEELMKLDLHGVQLKKNGEKVLQTNLIEKDANSESESEEKKILLQSLTCIFAKIEEKKNEELDRIRKENEPIICSSCGKMIKRSIKFCNYCGNPNDVFLKECPNCKKKIQKDAKFCNYCGFDMK